MHFVYPYFDLYTLDRLHHLCYNGYSKDKECVLMQLTEKKRILAAICAAEREGAELILHAHGILAECKTGHRDVVTEYDRKVQDLLIERLGAACPGARFFCEENDLHDDLNAEHLFIIDPIDGTMNFVRGMNQSCISVAYRNSGVIEAAAVCNPYAQECFTALREAGAFLNGRPIHADPGPLSESIVCCGTAPYREELTTETFRLMEIAYRASLDIRRQGSAALDLCSVAAGRAGAYFELSLCLWDYAAGYLIIQEAGGICTQIDGSELPFDGRKPAVLAGGPQAWKDFRELMQ